MRIILALTVLGGILFISGCGRNACTPPPRRSVYTASACSPVVDPLPPPAPYVASACTTNYCPPPTPL